MKLFVFDDYNVIFWKTNLLKTYLGYSPIEIYDPPKKWPFFGGVVLFLTILMIRYGHITLQDLTWVYLGRSKFFIELAASFRPLPATSKSQNTPFWAKNSLFWSGSHQFSFLNTFTIWYGFISLRTQIYMYIRWSKNFMDTPAPFRPLWATPKSKYSIYFSCFSSNFVKIL